MVREDLAKLKCKNCVIAINNPIKAGGSESMYSLGGAFGTPPPLEKLLRE